MSKIINIISIGKLSENYQHIADDYQKMIKWQINSAEITYSQKLPATQIKQFEAKLITQRYRHKSSRTRALDDIHHVGAIGQCGRHAGGDGGDKPAAAEPGG